MDRIYYPALVFEGVDCFCVFVADFPDIFFDAPTRELAYKLADEKINEHILKLIKSGSNPPEPMSHAFPFAKDFVDSNLVYMPVSIKRFDDAPLHEVPVRAEIPDRPPTAFLKLALVAMFFTAYSQIDVVAWYYYILLFVVNYIGVLISYGVATALFDGFQLAEFVTGKKTFIGKAIMFVVTLCVMGILVYFLIGSQGDY